LWRGAALATSTRSKQGRKGRTNLLPAASHRCLSLAKHNQRLEGRGSQVIQSSGVSLPWQRRTEKARMDCGEKAGKGSVNEQLF